MRLLKRIRQLSDAVLAAEEGSLYSTLQRMLMEGWVSAEWATSETKQRVNSPLRHARTSRSSVTVATESRVPSDSLIRCQFGTEPRSSACSPGCRLPTLALCDQALWRTTTAVTTSSDGTTKSASACAGRKIASTHTSTDRILVRACDGRILPSLMRLEGFIA